jgi:hypothetical protein
VFTVEPINDIAPMHATSYTLRTALKPLPYLCNRSVISVDLPVGFSSSYSRRARRKIAAHHSPQSQVLIRGYLASTS